MRAQLAAAVVCCLLALQGAEAESFLRNHAEAESFLGQHTIPETTARNPLDYNKSVDDEMTTFYMENHFHCLEKDDWPRASAAIQSKDVFSMQCCDDSSSMPCREVWCIHSPGEQIMSAWSDEDRCKRIGGLFGTRMSGGVNKNACCHASCGVCGGLSCQINPATGLPDPVRASNCCLDQIIDKTTTNATTGVVTTYPNKACGSPPCVLGTNLVFPVGQAGLDAISSHIVNYAGDPCHTTSRDHLLRSLANFKVNELRIPDSTSSFEVTDMTRHGDEVYIVSNRVTEMGSATPVQPVCMVHKVNSRTGKPMWPGPLKLNRHVVGSPVRFKSRGEFSQRRAEITVEEQRISGEWRMVSEAGITYITNPAGAHLNAGQDRTAYDNSLDAEISFGLRCAAGVTVKFQGHARSFSDNDGKSVKLQLFDDEGHSFPANAPVDAQFVQTYVDRFEWTAAADGISVDVTVPSEAVYTVKLTKPSKGFAIRALRLVGGSEQVCYWLPKEVTNFMVVAFKDGFVAKYTDPVYDPARTTQLSPSPHWERHVTGAAQASVVVVGAPSVGGRWSSWGRQASSSLAWRDALKSEVCVNEIGFDCSPWETAPGTTSSKRTDLPCTPQAASKCCICGRGEYLAIPTFEYVAVLDAGDGSALLGSKSLPTPATANSRTPSQYFKVPRGTYSQVRQRCRSASPPADLAVITGADENAMAQAACRFMNHSEGSCFIGLHRPPASSVRTPHEWITGEGGVFDSLVNNWKSVNINPGNQSDRPAAVIRVSDGTWDTALDSDEYAGICAYTLPEVPAEVQNSWNPQLYGATFEGAEWAPNENVTTYFYKVSRTQGTKTAAMQGIGPFEIPGPWVLTTSKGVTQDTQRRMPFATDKCTKMDYSSGKVVDDPDCCASNATWVGCRLGYELIHREPGVGTEGCNTGSNRKTRCKRASYADFSSGYKLPDTPGGPFKFAVRGRYDRNYMLEARSVDSSKMLELTIHGTSGSPARTIRARQSVMAARGARAQQGPLQGVPADPLGGYMQACANIGGILRDMPPPGSFTPGSELYACCPASCGACGGANCVNRTGGAPNCCTSDVNTANLACSNTQAPPCVFRGQEHFTSYTDVTWSGSPPGKDSTSSNNFEWELRLVYRPAQTQTYTCLTAAHYPPAYNAVSENFLNQRGVNIQRERCESMNYLDDNFHYKWNGVDGNLNLVASCTSSCVRGNIPAAWYWELHWDGENRLELVADKLFNLQDLASVQGTSVEPLSVAQIKTHELPDTYSFSMVDVVWEDDEDDALSNYRIVYGTFGVSLLLWDYQGAGKRLTEVWTAKHDGTSIATQPRIVWDHNGTQNDGALIYYGYGTKLYARVMLTTNNTGDQTFGMQPGALLWMQELHGDIVAPVNLEESGGLGVMYVSTSEPAILYGLKQATRSNETASIHPLGSGVNHAPPVLSNSRKAGQDPPSHVFVSMADKVHLISTGSNEFEGCHVGC